MEANRLKEIMPDYLRDWYYIEFSRHGNGLVKGPFTIEEMRSLMEQGRVNERTQVRCGINTRWHALRDVSAIFSRSSTSAEKHVLSGFRIDVTVKRVITAILIVALFAAFYLWHKQKGPDKPSFTREELTKEAIITLTNSARASHGLPALNGNVLLDAVAEARVKDMIDKQYFDHVSPTGEQAADIAQRVGYRYKSISENIASGLFFTSQKLVDGWMQSPGHQKNILSPDVKDIGVSVIKGRLKGTDGWVSAQVFGLQSLPVSEKNCAQPSHELVRMLQVRTGEMQALNERVKRLKEELDAEKYSIDLERLAAGNDPKRSMELNSKIKTYNEKVLWHNQSVAELKGKNELVKSMAAEHDKEVQRYRDCEASKQ